MRFWRRDTKWRRRNSEEREPAACVESLERRWLLSAGHAVVTPINIVGQFTGSSAVSFSPAKSHAPATDSIALSVTSENAKGSVAGTLTDSFGGSASVAGRVRGTRLVLSITNTRASGDRGSLVLKVSSDGKTLTGQLKESHRSGKSGLRWHGALALSALQSSSGHTGPDVTKPTGPLASGKIDLLGRYLGAGSGTYTFDPDVGPTPYNAAVSLSITSQSADGSVIGNLGGFGSQGAVVGTLSGSTLTLHSKDATIITTASFQIYADGTFYGTINTSAPILYQSFSGTAKLQKLPPPVEIVGTFTGTANVTDTQMPGASFSAPISLQILTEAPDGSLTGRLDAFGLSAPLTGTVTGRDIVLTADNVNENVSITGTVDIAKSEITGTLDEQDLLLPHEWKGNLSLASA